MKTSEDRLDVLKARYLKQIDAKQSEISAIRQKLALLDELKAEADSLSLFPAAPVADAVKADALNGHPLPALGLTDAIMQTVSWFGTKPFTPPDMRKHLLTIGFKPSGKNFDVSVSTTLKRLADQKRILKDTLDGKTVYMAKP